MMGGDLDASSKCIAGIHIVGNDAYLLIVVSIRFALSNMFGIRFLFSIPLRPTHTHTTTTTNVHLVAKLV